MYYSLILQQSPGSANPVVSFLPIILIFAIFYFLLFLPMQRQKKRQQQMLNELKSGDTVVTSGGIVGTIVKIEGDKLVLRVNPDNLKLQFLRSAVSARLSEESSK